MKHMIDHELLEWSGQVISWYNPDVLKETEELLKKYYTGKAKGELRFLIELALKHVKDDPAYQVLELTYEKQWHSEHIAKHFKCSEDKVPKLLDKMIKRVAIDLFGVDAFAIDLD